MITTGWFDVSVIQLDATTWYFNAFKESFSACVFGFF